MIALPAHATGVGLRPPHWRALVERPTVPDFVEVHSENFFLEGGAAMHALERARARCPVSLHGVGLSLGSADRLADAHLARLKRLVDRIEPVLVSEHLSWGAIDGIHLNDLLPLPHTRAALSLLADRVDHVQAVLGRTILLENLSRYVECRDDEMTETAFLAELARRTGCGLLLDLNNLHVNAMNFGFDAVARLDELDGERIGQIHLAGHVAVDGCLVDTHGAPVDDAVWALYAAACRRFGRKPTLIERDAELPPLDVLLAEAARAHAVGEAAAAHD